jgi:hypothetical protein
MESSEIPTVIDWEELEADSNTETYEVHWDRLELQKIQPSSQVYYSTGIYYITSGDILLTNNIYRESCLTLGVKRPQRPLSQTLLRDPRIVQL